MTAFNSITARDWRDSIQRARAQRNEIAEQIKLHMSTKTGFILEQCRKMAEDAQDARKSGSLSPMAEFDPERILWLVDRVEQLEAMLAAREAKQ